LLLGLLRRLARYALLLVARSLSLGYSASRGLFDVPGIQGVLGTWDNGGKGLKRGGQKAKGKRQKAKGQFSNGSRRVEHIA